MSRRRSSSTASLSAPGRTSGRGRSRPSSRSRSPAPPAARSRTRLRVSKPGSAEYTRPEVRQLPGGVSPPVAASSVAPIVGLSGLPASLPRTPSHSPDKPLNFRPDVLAPSCPARFSGATNVRGHSRSLAQARVLPPCLRVRACRGRRSRAWRPVSGVHPEAKRRWIADGSGPTGVLVTLRASGSGKPQAIDVQLLAVSEVSTLDNTSCSRVEARAPDDRQLGLRSDLALAVGMHRASGEPSDEIDPDLLPRHCGEHVAVGAHIGTFRRRPSVPRIVSPFVYSCASLNVLGGTSLIN